MKDQLGRACPSLSHMWSWSQITLRIRAQRSRKAGLTLPHPLAGHHHRQEVAITFAQHGYVEFRGVLLGWAAVDTLEEFCGGSNPLGWDFGRSPPPWEGW